MKDLIEKIMVLARAKSYYLVQGDIEYPKSDKWYSEKSDQIMDCDIIDLTTLKEILEEISKCEN